MLPLFLSYRIQTLYLINASLQNQISDKALSSKKREVPEPPRNPVGMVPLLSIGHGRCLDILVMGSSIK